MGMALARAYAIPDLLQSKSSATYGSSIFKEISPVPAPRSEQLPDEYFMGEWQ